MGTCHVKGAKVLRTGAFLLLCLAGTATISGAAVGQGRSGMSTDVPIENARLYRDLSRFGRCFVEGKRNRALALIATVPGSQEEAQAFGRLNREQGCLLPGNNISIPTVYYRGIIAEALYHANEGVPESHILPAPTVDEVRTLSDTARCYASGHRPQVQGLLATELGSAEQGAAVASLWEGFRACLPPEARIRLNATWIRFLLAEALLRLPPDGPATAAANQ